MPPRLPRAVHSRYLALSLISACADPIEQPVLVEIPAQLLEQFEMPTLASDAVGDVALLIVVLASALKEANGQLTTIEELVARWEVALA